MLERRQWCGIGEVVWKSVEVLAPVIVHKLADDFLLGRATVNFQADDKRQCCSLESVRTHYLTNLWLTVSEELERIHPSKYTFRNETSFVAVYPLAIKVSYPFDNVACSSAIGLQAQYASGGRGETAIVRDVFDL